jgi:hypothetical protein
MHVSNKARPAGLAWAGTARSADALAQPEWRLPSPAGVCACSECCQLVVLGAARGVQHKSPVGGAERKANASDFWYDVAGWVCLAGIVTGWIALARNAAPATAPAVK